MTFNLSLAVIAVILGWLTLLSKNSVIKIITGLLWILFLPNTIYMVTDIRHLPDQFLNAGSIMGILLVLQYTILMILAVMAFILALYPVDRIIQEKLSVKIRYLLLLFIMYSCSLGILLGLTYRLHSVDAFFRLPFVLSKLLELTSNLRNIQIIIFSGTLLFVLYVICSMRMFPIHKKGKRKKTK